jgi:hypothetical protein
MSVRPKMRLSRTWETYRRHLTPVLAHMVAKEEKCLIFLALDYRDWLGSLLDMGTADQRP